MRRSADLDHDYYNDNSQRYRNNPRMRTQDYLYEQSGELSPAAFNALIGIVLCFGLFVNYLMAKYCTEYFLGFGWLKITVIYIIMSIIGVCMSRFSHNPFISFIGYCLVVIPVGMVLCVDLAFIDVSIIQNAILITALIVVVMTVFSTLFPRVFMSMGGALGIALLAVVIVELVMMVFNIIMPTILSVIIVGIFSLYIGYDWAVAHEQHRTADAAIDACTALYLDIVNIFAELLYILGSSRDY